MRAGIHGDAIIAALTIDTRAILDGERRHTPVEVSHERPPMKIFPLSDDGYTLARVEGCLTYHSPAPWDMSKPYHKQTLDVNEG